MSELIYFISEFQEVLQAQGDSFIKLQIAKRGDSEYKISILNLVLLR